MKFRYVLVILAGVLLTAVVMTLSSIARYEPNHYSFLGSANPKKVTLEPDPIGWVGREVRYYVVHVKPSNVAAQAQSELQKIGWKRVSTDPAVFGRGEHERIDVRGADQYADKKLLSGIPANELALYTVIKVVDPRMPPALRQRLARWKHPIQRLKSRFA